MTVGLLHCPCLLSMSRMRVEHLTLFLPLCGRVSSYIPKAEAGNRQS